ncbi:hypothetical protein MTP19_08715 [Escherichia coli]|nr:hypothetical protein MTP19_08715 [Escherichia coli]
MYSNLERLILLVMRKIYFKANGLSPVTQVFENYVTKRDGEANEFIYELIRSNKPLMVSKFGTIELNALVSHQLQHKKNIIYQINFYSLKGKYQICGGQ